MAKINSYITKINRYKKILRKYSKYLKNGLFYLNYKNGRSFVSNKQHIGMLPKDGQSRKLLLFLRTLSFCLPYINTVGKKRFQGEAVYFNNSSKEPSEIKVFNYGKGVMMTIYFSKARYEQVKSLYETIHDLFPTPKKQFNDLENYIIEEIVEGWGRDNVSEEAFCALIEFYNLWFQKELLANNFKVIDGNAYYLQHGDLSLDNFNYSKDGHKLLFIDFDWLNYYPKYYDLFFKFLIQTILVLLIFIFVF